MSKVSVQHEKVNKNIDIRSYLHHFLKDLGLLQYFDAFSAAGYDTQDVLRQLTEEDLDAIGITIPGIRKRILLCNRSARKRTASTSRSDDKPKRAITQSSRRRLRSAVSSLSPSSTDVDLAYALALSESIESERKRQLAFEEEEDNLVVQAIETSLSSDSSDRPGVPESFVPRIRDTNVPPVLLAVADSSFSRLELAREKDSPHFTGMTSEKDSVLLHPSRFLSSTRMEPYRGTFLLERSEKSLSSTTDDLSECRFNPPVSSSNSSYEAKYDADKPRRGPLDEQRTLLSHLSRWYSDSLSDFESRIVTMVNTFNADAVSQFSNLRPHIDDGEWDNFVRTCSNIHKRLRICIDETRDFTEDLLSVAVTLHASSNASPDSVSIDQSLSVSERDVRQDDSVDAFSGTQRLCRLASLLSDSDDDDVEDRTCSSSLHERENECEISNERISVPNEKDQIILNPMAYKTEESNPAHRHPLRQICVNSSTLSSTTESEMESTVISSLRFDDSSSTTHTCKKPPRVTTASSTQFSSSRETLPVQFDLSQPNIALDESCEADKPVSKFSLNQSANSLVLEAIRNLSEIWEDVLSFKSVSLEDVRNRLRREKSISISLKELAELLHREGVCFAWKPGSSGSRSGSRS